MKEKRFKLSLEGSGAEQKAHELSLFIEKEFGTKPIPLREPIHKEDEQKADPLTITALILAVPSAVLATVDLIDRIRKKKATDRLIKWAEEQHKKDPNITIHITTPDGISLELYKAKSVEIMDAASDS